MARDTFKRAKCPTTGKVRYSTESQARGYAARRIKAPMDAYVCRHCGKWHLSTPRAQKVAARPHNQQRKGK